MNGAYTKLFSGIVMSTVWFEDHPTRIVWITMLALADRHGEIRASVPGLAHMARVSAEECQKAIDKFLAPEPSKHDDGRRIEEIDHGWAILNHGKYRLLASKDEAKEKHAERQKRYRNRKTVTVTPSDGVLTQRDATVTQDRDIAEAEAEAEAKIDTSNDVSRAFAEFLKAADRHNWPKPRKLDPDRRKKLQARIVEYGMDGWASMLEHAEASEFLNAQFPLKFDWVIQPANFRKVIEGNYNKANGSGGRIGPGNF